ncbi:MAG: hypothetical protein IJR54_05265 [Oscillibacter sp.]|nr:hypothetical protein [Oscillibacter sp.]
MKTKLSMKFGAVMLAAALLLSCAACGAQSARDERKPYGVDGSVLFNKDGVTVATTGWTTDPTDAEEPPLIGLEIRNTGDKDLCLGVENGSVNDFMIDLNLIEFYIDEDGHYYGGNYAYSLMIPANGGGEYALGFPQSALSLAGIETIGKVTMTFTLAQDDVTSPYYKAEPITIETGNAAEAVGVDALGTVVLDNDALQLALGALDYDSYFGPVIPVYVRNKTEQFIRVSPVSANADGNECDYIFYGVSLLPGKYSAQTMTFDSPIRERKSVENLTLSFEIREGKDMDALEQDEGTLESVSITYPPQEWGEYENGGLRLEIQPKYNALLTVGTPENDPDGILFTIAETASAEAGGYADGAGELLRIGRVDEDRLHELLCEDMSGMYVFAQDGNGGFYLVYHPTDVRYMRATNEEMARDQAQWTMLNEWAEDVPELLREQNEGLENLYRGNTTLDMYLARAAYRDGVKYALSGPEYGPLEPDGVDGAPYAEFLLDGGFFVTEPDEVPEEPSVVLAFPEEDLRFEFFSSQGNVVRETSGDSVTFYENFLYDENMTFADVMQAWYYALAEKAGRRERDAVTDAFTGTWVEETAGRGTLTFSPLLVPGRLRVEANWPNSSSETVTWEMTARLTDENTFRYENGARMVMQFDETGEGYVTEESQEQSGYFYLNNAGQLCWHDDQAEGTGDSVFIAT